ncbi:cation efflux protein [Cryphonectria parasitica EP155]|uniref:Cation efflux protein n=1 Tax=Cryphonectria parasitica (strain ATCC 38755 / EP155) TaxID=660469 RepID=A0A9P4Y0Q6_CRYP1|nr:cation efflux protein [Cryphonectria parasitica EP155]KAF3764393.1 cation efflux protein [Cryphonectria parasitica EP155]
MAWSKSTRISIMLAIDVAFFLVELISGFLVHSLVLMADAFHMLNDIISLLVGLWAVRLAQKATTDKYSYGWLRAEILGAFFNAVFLIALCVSIVLEAVTRFFEPPEISNPKLILIVGSLGLASNLVGFLVLGGHGHSHGHEHGDEEHGHEHAHGHGHSHNDLSEAEEGRVGANQAGDESEGPILESRRRGSTGRNNVTSIDDISIYPSFSRQDILAATRPQPQELSSDSGDDVDDAAVSEQVTENTPLIGKRSGSVGNVNGKHVDSAPKRGRSRRDSSLHNTHNHNKPRKAGQSSHGHNHADMGMNAMILHVLGDALGNVGVIVTALIIWLTDWPGKYYADPAVSLFITLIILKSALPLTFATSKILLQATPEGLEVQDIREDIEALPGVITCHHVHIWQLSDSKIVASMHIHVAFPISEAGGEKYMELARRVRRCLHAYGIHSATIQPEFCLDQTHGHVQDAEQVFNIDGTAEMRRCNATNEGACLLECVDDCVGQGCCSTSATAVDDSVRSDCSSHSAHSHGEVGHAHDH